MKRWRAHCRRNNGLEEAWEGGRRTKTKMERKMVQTRGEKEMRG